MVNDLAVTRATNVPAELERVCRDEYRRVFGALVLYTGERALAEELTQEAFARACRDWRKVSRLDRPGAWVHRVAMNLARSRFRRRGSRRRAEARMRSAAAEHPIPPTAESLAVRDGVASLPDDERAVIVMRYFADLSVADTADVLGVPVGTVKTRTRRALATLRSFGLGVEQPDEDTDPLIEVRA